jgi:hypothetical protein
VLLQGMRRQRLHIGAARDIGTEERRLSSMTRCDLAAEIGKHVAHHDLGAFARQNRDDSFADPACTPEDDRRPPFQPTRHVLPCSLQPTRSGRLKEAWGKKVIGAIAIDSSHD